MVSFDNTGRVISESLVAQKAHTLSIARKGAQGRAQAMLKACCYQVDSRVILSSVVGSGEGATAGHVASTLNIFINPKAKPRTFGFWSKRSHSDILQAVWVAGCEAGHGSTVANG